MQISRRIIAIVTAAIFGLGVIAYGVILGSHSSMGEDSSLNRIVTRWVGVWQTGDADNYPFLLEIKRDGSAFQDYGAGSSGRWRIHEGGLLIEWADGHQDYLFDGVMGMQRLHKPVNPRARKYSSFMKKMQPKK